MKTHRSGLTFAIASSLLATVGVAPAVANRPDRLPVLNGYQASDASHQVAVENISFLNYGFGMIPRASLVCSAPVTAGTTAGTVYLDAVVADPDVTGNKKTKISGKQSAYTNMTVVFFDGMNFSSSATANVPSCKSSWSLKDGDKNQLLVDPADSIGFKLACGDDVATTLGLDAVQSGMLAEAFGSKPKCSFAGVPVQIVSGCFRGDALVETERGPRPIRDVRVGEKVWSWNEKTGARELSPVLQTMVFPARDLREVVAGGEIFHVTGTHPFWVDSRGWTKAADLARGDVVRTLDGAAFAVTSNRRASEESFYAGYDTAPDRVAALRHPLFAMRPASLGRASAPEGIVYNLEVAGGHTFYVGSSRVLVHNK